MNQPSTTSREPRRGRSWFALRVLCGVAPVCAIGYGLSLPGRGHQGEASSDSHNERADICHVERLKLENANLFKELGLDPAVFAIKAPRDCKVMIWLEAFSDGRRVARRSFGLYSAPGRGKHVQGVFRLSIFDPPTASDVPDKKVRWSLGFVGNGPSIMRWDVDPFARFAHGGSTGACEDAPTTWKVEPGKELLLWWRTGTLTGGTSYGAPEQELMKNDFVIMLKCKTQPTARDHVWETAGELPMNENGVVE